jgi:serine/threonine protein kinase
MSPEVAKECPYNKSVDVYSFGILLWELCAAEKPFYGYSSGKHMQQVVIGGERPRMDAQHTAHWPANLQWLMNQCWSPFPTVRPSFTVIKHVLNDILSGEETVPQSLADISEEKEQEASDHGSVEAPASGFGSIFPLSRKKPRSKTHEVELPKDGFKSIKPSAKTGRARTWGFGLRK